METLQPKKIKWQGSILNRIDEHRCYKKENQPVVGMGATEYMWSDRRPYTVCVVHNNWNKKGYEIIGVQEDDAKRIDKNGMSEDQQYEFTPNIENFVYYLKSEKIQTQNGIRKIYQPVHWNPKTNRWNKGGKDVTLGKRSYYYDYSF